MLLMMSLGFECLAAHSGPPLAASQGNSRARAFHSLAAPVTRAAFSGPCPTRRTRSSLRYSGLWFPLFPLVKGKHSKPSKETT